jgi:aspartyl-tRNA(Asn)/glutamyl-tRNA(Gln) amidotransferase subunit C
VVGPEGAGAARSGRVAGGRSRGLPEKRASQKMVEGESMTRISPDEVREIAGLARLRLDEAEIARFTQELDGILGYIETVKGLDTENVLPMTHAVPFDCPMRADEVGNSLSIEEALQNAPRRHESSFEVPRIVPGTGGA